MLKGISENGPSPSYAEKPSTGIVNSYFKSQEEMIKIQLLGRIYQCHYSMVDQETMKRELVAYGCHTNCHKCDGLKQHILTVSQLCRSEGCHQFHWLKWRCQEGLTASRGSGEDPFSCPFLPFLAWSCIPYNPWLLAPPSTFKASGTASSFRGHKAFLLCIKSLSASLL